MTTLRTVLRIILALAAFAISSSNASATELVMGGSPTKAFLEDGVFTNARLLYPSCNWKDDFVKCRELVIELIVGNIGLKKYPEAARYIDDFYKGVTADGGRWPSPCPGDSLTIADKIYIVGYYQTVYRIWKGMNSPMADKYALRAFLCAAYRTANYTFLKGSDDGTLLSRKEFVKAIKASRSGDPRFDVDLYLDDVLATTIKMKKELEKDGTTLAAEIKVTALFKNGAERCRELGLDPAFAKFHEELATSHTFYVKELGQNR
ncbi:hypothetical protein [Rhizobium leguminosarum]